MIRLILSLSAEKDEKADAALAKALKIALIVAVVVIAIFLLASGDAASALVVGSYALLFWLGVVVIGIVAPVVIDTVGKNMAIVTSVLVLLGVFLYRWVVLYGGQV